MTPPIIDEFEIEYAFFNAQKTLSTNTPSAFEHARFGDLLITRDPARPDAYYNRILGLTPRSVDQLDQAIAWIEQGTAPEAEVRVDISLTHAGTGTGISNQTTADLTSRGFRHVDTLLWMHQDGVQLERAERDHDDLERAELERAELERAHHQRDTDAPAISAIDIRELTTQDWPSIRRNREQEWPIEDLIWQHKRQYLCTDTFRWFGIFDSDELVSTASTWTTPAASNVTILGSAFTLPQYRNQGHQGQLLEARCRLVPGPLFVDVAPDSSSYRNCVRAGFTDLDLRQVWTQNTRP